MKRKTALLLIASAVLAAAGGGYIYYTMTAAPTVFAASAAAAQTPRVQTVNGETVVLASVDEQRASHIDVAPLATSKVQPEITAYTSTSASTCCSGTIATFRKRAYKTPGPSC
ncbi:MAG: hypothetical protein B7X10_06900 [Burkholderiales bacterium 21-58-4]|nr:MAG: hypothetical protein B7X10_06900 [Burkholderiales bacterium 21-58-4]